MAAGWYRDPASATRPGITSGHAHQGVARRAAWLLRRGRDGHQGPHLDGAGLRAAGVLLSRDRPQRRGGRCVRAGRRAFRRRHRRCPGGQADHAVGPRLGTGGRGGRGGSGRRDGRRGLPPRHQGPSRGPADGGSGLRRHLRRTCRARRSRWCRRRGAPRGHAGRPRRRPQGLLPHRRRPRGPARPDHPRRLRVGERVWKKPRSATRSCSPPARATSATPRQTGKRRCGDWPNWPT